MPDLLAGQTSIEGWQRDKAIWLDSLQRDQADHARQRDDFEFTVEQKHYENDDNQTLDRRRVKPKSPSLWNLIRHLKSQVLKGARNFEVRPIGGGTDPIAAEFWKRRIDLWDNNSANNLRETLDDLITGAFAAGDWCLEWSYHPYRGAILKAIPSERVSWHSAFKAPYDPDNPVVQVWDRVSVQWLEMMGKNEETGWKNTKDCPADDGPGQTVSASTDADKVSFGGSSPIGAGTSNIGMVTILKSYYRFEYEKVKGEPLSMKMLDPMARYMKCPNCGEMSPPQIESMVEYPVTMPCPACGMALMERQDAEELSPEVLKFRRGQMLRITAPFAGRTFYEGSWWFESETDGFPVDMWKPNPNPRKRHPLGITAYYKSLVSTENAMLRMGYEGMLRAKGILLAPEDGVVDHAGNPWQFSDWQDVAYYTEAMPKGGIDYIQPPGLPAGFVPFLQSIQNVFASNKGTGDIGLTPDKSRDIAAQSLQLQVETGEIPVDDHKASFQAFYSRIKTRQCEILKSLDPPEMVLDLMDPMGVPVVINARSIPNVDILVTAEHKVSQEQADNLGKMSAVMATAAGNPLMIQTIAEMVGLPPRYSEKMMQAAAMMVPQEPPSDEEGDGPPSKNGKKDKGGKSVPNGKGPSGR